MSEQGGAVDPVEGGKAVEEPVPLPRPRGWAIDTTPLANPHYRDTLRWAGTRVTSYLGDLGLIGGADAPGGGGAAQQVPRGSQQHQLPARGI